MVPERVLRVAVATGNEGKLREIRAILDAVHEPFGLPALELHSLAELPAVALPEEGDAYEANALAKARAAAAQLGLHAIADDSGIEVDALGGAPGPFSARYGGEGLDDAGRVRALLEATREAGGDARSARFVCVAAWASPDGRSGAARGVCEGRLRREPAGASGFGYDPIFEPRGEGRRTMAELSAARKDLISHRARAFTALVQTVSWARRSST